MEINPKHKAFADEYLNNGRNATRAYMTVYKPKKLAGAEASSARLLSNAKVQAYIAKVDGENLKTKEISKEKYIKYLDSLVEQAQNTGDGDHSKLAIDSIKIIGKWEGYESPDKTQFLGKDGKAVDPVIQVEIIKPKKNE